MLDFEFIDGYLNRIEVDSIPSSTPEALVLLQTSHVKHIPFENLDIINGDVPLRLDIDGLYDKLVARRRGGICYEQNILFAHVLEVLGFNVRRMASHDPLLGQNEFDHMFLMVDFPKRNETWISDVGFGQNNLAPIKFEVGTWQSDMRNMLCVDRLDAHKYDLVRRTSIGDEEVMYEFNLTSHVDAEYRLRCDSFSMDEDSFFRQGPMVSIDALGGRKLLTRDHFRYYDENADEVVVDVHSKEEFDELLYREFGIVL